MRSYKSTETEVGKKDKKLKDIENSKSAANQRSAIDTLSRQLQDERKVSVFRMIFPSFCLIASMHFAFAGAGQLARERGASRPEMR